MEKHPKNSHFIQRVLTSSVYSIAKETPVWRAENLSRLTNNEFLVKREDMQPTLSYKVRGAAESLNAKHIDNAEEIYSFGAYGNATSMALCATRKASKLTIVSPKNIPRRQIDTIQRFCARVILSGESFDMAREKAISICRKNSGRFIDPFNNAGFAVGYGTIFFELLRACHDIEWVFVPVFSGQLLASACMYIKALHPETKIIGVESADFVSVSKLLGFSNRYYRKRAPFIAREGSPRRTTRLISNLADDMVYDFVVVGKNEIVDAQRILYDDLRTIIDPHGALATAGAIKYIEKRGIRRSVIATVCTESTVSLEGISDIMEKHRRTILAKKSDALAATRRDGLDFIKNMAITKRNGKAVAVFISYAKEDIDFARGLYRDLKYIGFDPWLDEHDLLPGQDWRLVIRNRIKISEFVIFVVSKKSSTKRGFVQAELSTALDVAMEVPSDGIFIIPVIIENCALPARIEKYHCIDYYKDDGLKKIVKALSL